MGDMRKMQKKAVLTVIKKFYSWDLFIPSLGNKGGFRGATAFIHEEKIRNDNHRIWKKWPVAGFANLVSSLPCCVFRHRPHIFWYFLSNKYFLHLHIELTHRTLLCTLSVGILTHSHTRSLVHTFLPHTRITRIWLHPRNNVTLINDYQFISIQYQDNTQHHYILQLIVKTTWRRRRWSIFFV